MLATLQPPSKRGRLIKPHRVSPAPKSFGEGLIEEEWTLRCPIDSRPLPTVDGVGLLTEEQRRITGARNRARAAYAFDCPEADANEIEAVARKAATDELRRTLRDRPAAPPLKAPEPIAQAEEPIVAPKAAPSRATRKVHAADFALSPHKLFHSWADEAWESAWHVAQELGLAPVCGGGEDDPEVSAFDRWLAENEPEPMADLSDDRNGGFIGEPLY